MTDIDAMMLTVLEWVERSSDEDKAQFKACEFDDLIIYHHQTLGATIRNVFGLWSNRWEPVLINGVDHSPNHPDAISMRVIEAVWKHLNKKDGMHEQV